jgi:hypothetical protein
MAPSRAVRIASRFTFVSIIFSSTAAGAQDSTPPTPRVAPPLFESDSLLVLTLRTDLKSLVRERDSTRIRYHPAKISFAGASDSSASINAQVRARGHYRRQRKICDFPPVGLRFDKETKGSVFAQQRNLKLVTRCQRERSEYEQYVLQEYLLYRVYNLLTPHSFRVRLARITYEDVANAHPSLSTYAFFLEGEKDMARRNGGSIVAVTGARRDDLVSEQWALLAMFQYLIGNTDWSIAGLHNIVLVQTEPGTVYPVPYDFDWAGVIETRYAVPDYRLPIKSVRERLYRGYCVSEEELRSAYARLSERREDIYSLLGSFAALDRRVTDGTRRYFDDFYKTIGNSRRMRDELTRSCLKQ